LPSYVEEPTNAINGETVGPAGAQKRTAARYLRLRSGSAVKAAAHLSLTQSSLVLHRSRLGWLLRCQARHFHDSLQDPHSGCRDRIGFCRFFAPRKAVWLRIERMPSRSTFQAKSALDSGSRSRLPKTWGFLESSKTAMYINWTISSVNIDIPAKQAATPGLPLWTTAI